MNTQLSEKELEVINELAEKFSTLPQEKRVEELEALVKFIHENNEDVEGMIKILQSAADRVKAEQLQ